MVRRRKGRDVQGIVLLNKPIGMTSNTALQKVKQLFNARKAGHTGSLDPIASGLLPICLGEATKVSGFLLDADKKYQTTVKLGIRTNTGDADGEIIETKPVDGIDPQQLNAVLQKFVGTIEQIPPMHSAIKQQGIPLYKLAHQGLEVDRKPRRVTIHDIRLTELRDDEIDLDIHCSKGTYIRTLAEDIGAAMEVGGHVKALHRTGVGPFRAADMVTLDRLFELSEQDDYEALDNLLLPMENALSHWPDVNLSDDAAHYVRQGQAVFVSRAVTHGFVRLFNSQQRFLGVGQILEDGRVAPRRLVNAR